MQPESRTNPSMLVGGVLVAAGMVALLGQFFGGMAGLVWAAMLAFVGAVFAVPYFRNREDWGLLIPAYVFWAVAGLIAALSLGFLQDGAIATYILSAIALPFLTVWAVNRDQWWWLIPSYVLLAVGMMILLVDLRVLINFGIPAYITMATGLPFFVAYAFNRREWWWLIPGGFFSGLAVLFLVLGPAGVFVPVLLIVGGILLLVSQFVPQRREPEPLRGPEADRAPLGSPSMWETPSEPLRGPEADKPRERV
ncbi:MAG: hypothetical protein GYB68_14580 [Chloroflexi bacterium]|nr:hypothetical protein [Chloroflexota bacterium]